MIKILILTVAFFFIITHRGFAQDIVQAEYFFDFDPGTGNGFAIDVSPAAEVNLNFTPNQDGLTIGFHTLYVRAKNSNGQWTHYSSRSFYKHGEIIPPVLSDINRIEYFINTDPGAGNAVPVNTTQATQTSGAFSIDQDTLPAGFHTLYIRGIDVLNRPSLSYALPFFIPADSAGPLPDITHIEYFYYMNETRSDIFVIDDFNPDTTAGVNFEPEFALMLTDSSYDFHIYGVNALGIRSLEIIHSNTGDTVTSVLNPGMADLIPQKLELKANYPNPFNPSTTIKFGLPQAGRITITIFDVLGREVIRLADEQMPAGYHQVNWDGKNALATHASSGFYIYQIQTTDGIISRKMLLLK
jgi:hypothetical protein